MNSELEEQLIKDALLDWQNNLSIVKNVTENSKGAITILNESIILLSESRNLNLESLKKEAACSNEKAIEVKMDFMKSHIAEIDSLIDSMEKMQGITVKMFENVNHRTVMGLASAEEGYFTLKDTYIKKIEKFITKLKTERNEDGDKVFSFLNYSYEINANWIDLFSHFILLDAHNKMPTKTWYEELSVFVENIGQSEFVERGTTWINDCIEKSKKVQQRYKVLGDVAGCFEMANDIKEDKTPIWVEKVYGGKLVSNQFFAQKKYYMLNNFQNYFYHSLGGRILRGFMHSTLVLNDMKLLDLVDRIAFTSPNNSQDPIHIYSKLDKELGVPRLSALKVKVKNKNVLSRINKALSEIGKKEGLSKAEIEESLVSDQEVNSDGEYKIKIEKYTLVYEIIDIKTFKTYCILENGEIQKSLPKYLKDNYISEVNLFKKNCKAIRTSLSVNRQRIETFYLINRKISYTTFKKNYLDNNLMKVLAKNLIWNFKSAKENINLIFKDNIFETIDGKKYKNLEGTTVKLWHPISSDADLIFKWRKYMLINEVLQPFKQAYREVYLLTSAEETTQNYSNRFAAHIILKNNVAALAKTRGWSTSGIINSGKLVYKIPESDYKAELRVSFVNLEADLRVFSSVHLVTDRITFLKKRTEIDLIDVPRYIFSEVMRDVDLFVGVASIGNDPEWYDKGEGGIYWSRYVSSDLTGRSKIRTELLKSIIPNMKIGKVCTFEGKYLIVRGKIRSYKIHLGSGNILMAPNDQYLCIVPENKVKSKVFVPFEGDSVLTIILSKAILLSDEYKIKDESIFNQINNL